jgi:hypothetical protein
VMAPKYFLTPRASSSGSAAGPVRSVIAATPPTPFLRSRIGTNSAFSFLVWNIHSISA